jgi:hypothetical protein
MHGDGELGDGRRELRRCAAIMAAGGVGAPDRDPAQVDFSRFKRTSAEFEREHRGMTAHAGIQAQAIGWTEQV